MSLGSLRTAVRDHGAVAITVDEFGAIVSTSAATIRGRRERDAEFPTPINTNATPLTYLLRDLFDWWMGVTREPGARAVDSRALARWTFTAAFEQCSTQHGADATRHLVAGAALLLADRWPLPARTPAQDQLGLLREHLAAVEPRFPPVDVDAQSFRPDPIPASDHGFMAKLLNWPIGSTERSARTGVTATTGAPAIADGSHHAAQLLSDLRSLHTALRPLTRKKTPATPRAEDDAFVEAIEPFVRGIARDTSIRSSSTALGLTRLMVSIVDPQPGDVIVDLACGQGSTFIETERAMQSAKPGRQMVGFIGRERDEATWTVAKFRLGLRGIAHDLGSSGVNGLDCDITLGPSHRFITEPGVRSPKLTKWIKRHAELLAQGGTAALAVPAEIVFSAKREGSRTWGELQSIIDAVVFTPTDTAVLVLRPGAAEWKSLVQIHRMTSAMAERRYWEQHPELAEAEDRPAVPLDAVDPAIEPFMPAQIERASSVAGRSSVEHRDGTKPSEGDEDFVQWRPIRALTIAALAKPRFGDCAAIRNAVPEPEPEPVRQAPANELVESPVAQEPRRRTSRESRSFAALRAAEKDDNTSDEAMSRYALDLEAQALDAVSFLRWVLDPATFAERPWRNNRLSPKINGALEELGTDEMRRALRRLELRLNGEETRGRRPSDGSKPRPVSAAPPQGEAPPTQ